MPCFLLLRAFSCCFFAGVHFYACQDLLLRDCLSYLPTSATYRRYLDAITYPVRAANGDIGGLTLRLANLRSDYGKGPDPMLSWLQFSRPMDRVSDWLKITPTASTNGFTWKESWAFALDRGGRLLTVEESKAIASRLGTSPYRGEDQWVAVSCWMNVAGLWGITVSCCFYGWL